MRVSALIPTYKSAATIVSCVESVLSQSVAPHEIIVLIDGETDNTRELLQPYSSRVRVMAKENAGIGYARNDLVWEATGDLVAFLDSDDLWHPDYLKEQIELFRRFPDAVAGFTGHLRFRGQDYVWPNKPVTKSLPELIDGPSFFARYNTTTAMFGSMSYTCVRKSALDQIGSQPFFNLRAAEDSYLCYRLSLLGPVAFQPAKLVAYRMTEGSLSENRVRNLGLWVSAFEHLDGIFLHEASPELRRQFEKYYAAKRREYAKILIAVDRKKEAWAELFKSLFVYTNAVSWMKSFLIFFRSFMPRRFQPASAPVRKIASANAQG